MKMGKRILAIGMSTLMVATVANFSGLFAQTAKAEVTERKTNY